MIKTNCIFCLLSKLVNKDNNHNCNNNNDNKDGVLKNMLVVVQPYNTLAYNENDSKNKKLYCLVCRAGIKGCVPY